MKSASFAVLLNLLFAAVGLLGNSAQPAEASTDVMLVYGSTLTSRVVVTTGAVATRIDNWSNGVSGKVLANRAYLQWQNLDAAAEIYCINNNSSVSTITANANIGFKYTAGTFASEGLAAGTTPAGQQTMWCRAADAGGASGVVIVTRQVSRT